MRRVFCALALLSACLLLLGSVCAASDVTAVQWESLDTRGLERSAAQSGVDLELTQSFTLQEGLQRLGERLPQFFQTALSQACRTGLVLLLAVLLSELTGVLGEIAGSGERYPVMVGALAVTAISAADVHSLMGLGRTAVEEIWTFSTLLIPVMTAVSAASGSFTGATLRQVTTLLFADGLVTLMDKVLLPMVYLYTAACLAAAVTDNPGLEELAKAIRWTVTSVLSALLLAFTGYLSLTSAAAAGADAVTVRLTRSVISTMVPVVGGILSNATDTVLSGVGVLKGVVGTFGVVAVLALGLGAFLQLGVQYLMYRLVSVLSQVLSGSRVARLIGDMASAFSLVLAMTATSALLVLISIFATLAVAVG